MTDPILGPAVEPTEAVYEAAARGWVNANRDIYADPTEESLAAAARRVMSERMVTSITNAVWPLAFAAGVAEGRRQAAEAIRTDDGDHARSQSHSAT